MNDSQFQPDPPAGAIDRMIVAASGPEPEFDPVMQDFLVHSHLGLKRSLQRGGLLEVACLGQLSPWLYRLTFRTRGFVLGPGGQITTTDRHVVALRFLSDYLRNADRFEMLRLVAPMGGVFHPNVSPSGAVCVEIYPGETAIEICHSLHDLFRWRLRQSSQARPRAAEPGGLRWLRRKGARAP